MSILSELTRSIIQGNEVDVQTLQVSDTLDPGTHPKSKQWKACFKICLGITLLWILITVIPQRLCQVQSLCCGTRVLLQKPHPCFKTVRTLTSP